MQRLTGVLGALSLLILTVAAQAASIPGAGSCGLREHAEAWMKDAGAHSPGYSLVDVVDPRNGEVIGQLEMSFWSNDAGETAVVSFRIIDDPQRGLVPFGCVLLRGEGNQSAPIFVPRKGV